MTIDKLTLVTEGFVFRRGMQEYMACQTRFYSLYGKKYGANYDLRQRNDTYMRYIVMWANRRKGTW